MQLPGLPALPSHGMHPSARENAATAPTGSRSMGIVVMLVGTESEQDQLQDPQRGNFNRALAQSGVSPGTTSSHCLALTGLSTVTQHRQQSIHSNRNHLEKNLCVEEGRRRFSPGQGRTQSQLSRQCWGKLCLALSTPSPGHHSWS